jgi:hypothetical protein
MADKTSMIMVLMVAVVAVVGLISIMAHGSLSSTQDSSNSLTGNIVASDGSSSGSLNSFGKVFFALFLVGIAGYMYRTNE